MRDRFSANASVLLTVLLLTACSDDGDAKNKNDTGGTGGSSTSSVTTTITTVSSTSGVSTTGGNATSTGGTGGSGGVTTGSANAGGEAGESAVTLGAAGGSSTGGTDGADACPATPPATQSPCESALLTCSYSNSLCVCGALWVCRTFGECPDTRPESGSDCTGFENQTCVYSQTCQCKADSSQWFCF